MDAELASLMLYKQWADAALLRAARRLPWPARLVLGRLIARILRHFHTVDVIFRAHLSGVAHGLASANPREPRTLAALESAMADVDAWYVAYARGLDARDAQQRLSLTFTDGDRQTLTRAQILVHVALHGAYHRGNVDLLLRIAGRGALPDRFTTYLRSSAQQ